MEGFKNDGDVLRFPVTKDQASTPGWGMLVIGLIIGTVTFHWAVTRPMTRQMQRMELQMQAMRQSMQQVAGYRQVASDGADVLAELAAQKAKVHEAAAALEQLDQLYRD